MELLNWGLTTEWMNENKTLFNVLFFFIWLIVGVVGSAIIDRCGGNQGGEISFIWLMWALFGWALILMIAAFPVMSLLFGVAIYIVLVACLKLYELIVNYGKESQ